MDSSDLRCAISMEVINTTQQDLVITRIIDAPRERVWKAWTEPEQIKRWWGPKDFTAPVVQIDLREGGKYLLSMKSPEGEEYWSTGVYKKIVENEKLVITDSFADKDGNLVPATYYGLSANFPEETRIVVTFESQDGNITNLTLTQVGLPVGEVLDQTKSGWNESLDKLEQSLRGID